ncbi:hypothetical protein EGO51_15915 [Haloarcula hispanica]|uniref:Uncharacterized protein n=1 Tax=Haloarcula hispanica TaxID=51589 RepID=A0A5J5LCW0_HALHI|nr:hypothetical protein EGO51_15915 [Haloarcula hispanica]
MWPIRCCLLKRNDNSGTEPTLSDRYVLLWVQVEAIVAIENQCTPDRTTAVWSVCTSLQLLL